MDISVQHTTTHSHWSTMTQAEKVASILKWTFGLVPIVAGADKFMHLLVDWDQYLAPQIAHMLPMSVHSLMYIVGIIEIFAGVLVLIKPRIGSIIVALWLIGIAINLLIGGQNYDIAIRDTVMAISAFCLFLLYGRNRVS